MMRLICAYDTAIKDNGTNIEDDIEELVGEKRNQNMFIVILFIAILKSHVQVSKRRPHIVWFHLHEIPKLHKPIMIENMLPVAILRAEGEMVITNRCEVSVMGDKNVLEVDSGH